ncbi:MAG: hypothetical protein SGPRY_004438, partial [Prymnesium sp.]
GSVYIFSLGEGQPLLLTLSSPQPSPTDRFGASVALGADWDEDGRRELVVGAPGEGGGGSLFILFLESDAFVRVRATEVDGLVGDARLGQAVALLGSLNDDRVEDLVAGVRLDANGKERVGGLAILFLAPFKYIRPPAPPPLPPSNPPASPQPFPPPRALAPPPLPPPPSASSTATVSAAQTVLGARFGGVGLAGMISLVLFFVGITYVFLIRRHSPLGQWKRVLRCLNFVASRPRALLKWARKPVMIVRVHSNLIVEVQKAHVRRSRKPRKGPPRARSFDIHFAQRPYIDGMSADDDVVSRTSSHEYEI